MDTADSSVPETVQNIPLSAGDVGLLTQLAFQWDLSPQAALRRALEEAVDRVE